MPNRLAREASPYLLQHAHNPVDWYPWGPEALETAKREDKPILLSIGYSACHWCHVMERESFEDPAIAAAMNEGFVNVKVDREERPDLDQIYQLVVQLTGRGGGWPLTVFLTPDQRPFFGGTYFPPVDRYGMPAFPRILRAVRETYQTRRGEISAHAAELVRTIENIGAAASAEAGAVSPETLRQARQKLLARFDDEHGGFGQRPKFPNPMSLELLLRLGERERTRKTLDAMRDGGVYDQLGGGFHRYSTDARWLVPHFEKMLYDNALLLRLYADGWRAFGDARYAQTAASIAAYVTREMTSPDGGFYATQDADSDGEEGLFFVWTPEEIDEACGDDVPAARAAKRIFGVTPEGNFEHGGKSVLSLVATVTDAEEAHALDRARAALLTARERRTKPARDDKLLASYGALMISALATSAGAIGPPLALAAERAMRFVERTLVVPDVHNPAHRRVLRYSKDGLVRGPGFLDDHAFAAEAALDVYEVTGDPPWVTLAQAIAESILEHFCDEARSSFYLTPDDGEPVVVRTGDPNDHAVPSGASVACRVFLRLGTLIDARYTTIGTRAVERLAAAARANPFGMSSTLSLVDRLVRGSVDVVLVGERTSSATRALAREASRAYLPDRVIAWVDPTDPSSFDACRALAEGKPARAEPVAYVCRGRTCSLPVSSPEELARTLRSA